MKLLVKAIDPVAISKRRKLETSLSRITENEDLEYALFCSIARNRSVCMLLVRWLIMPDQTRYTTLHYLQMNWTYNARQEEAANKITLRS